MKFSTLKMYLHSKMCCSVPVEVLETTGPRAKHLDFTEFEDFYTVFRIFHYFAGRFLPIWSVGLGQQPPGPHLIGHCLILNKYNIFWVLSNTGSSYYRPQASIVPAPAIWYLQTTIPLAPLMSIIYPQLSRCDPSRIYPLQESRAEPSTAMLSQNNVQSI